MAVNTLKSVTMIALLTGLVAGCEPGTGGGSGGDEVTTAPLDGTAPVAEGAATDAAKAPDATATPAVAPARSVKLVDRDVEAPQVFETTGKALWDGRPSLGGVWVAATNVTDPMRVIMRNPATGKFVIGALFRREADNPGPPLQISSDAADALGLVAGEPATISVIALRREEVAAPETDATKPLLDSSESVPAVAADAVAAVAATPAPKAGTTPEAPATKPAAKPAAAPEPAPAPAAAAGGKSIQIGIFSLEDNAKRAVATLKKAGIAATIRQESSHGKPLWSVVAQGDKTLLDKIRKAGFADAYFL